MEGGNMQPRVVRSLLGALAVAIIVVAGFAWQRKEPQPEAIVASQPPAPVQPAVRPSAPVPVSKPAALPATLFAGDAGQPLAVQVERLLATRDPQNAYLAYMLVSACAMFNRRHDLDLYDDKLRASRPMSADEKRQTLTLCGGMMERERLARLDYLAIAIEADVPGAALTFVSEGPFGDPSALETRPNDPLVREWKATAAAHMTRAAEAGHGATLVIWGLQNLSGSDLADRQPVLGYTYLLAHGFIEADHFGANSSAAQTYAEGSQLMSAMASRLDPEQRAAALAAARRLADKVKARRQGGEQNAGS